MSTILYNSPIYGPVESRRLGLSLGINLMPADGKVCTFDCIYCECGFNHDHVPKHHRPTREQVAEALEATLRRMSGNGDRLDDISFAGNGEPTAHPEFPEIVDDTIALRDRYYPKATVSVMSNSTFINHEKVRKALMRLDNNILKLDTISPIYIKKVDRPVSPDYDVNDIIRHMTMFNGNVIIQTMFMHGTADGKDVSNVSDEYVMPWLQALKTIRPSCVMVYTIDRSTPDQDLRKATHYELDMIRNKVESLGIKCIVGY